MHQSQPVISMSVEKDDYLPICVSVMEKLKVVRLTCTQNVALMLTQDCSLYSVGKDWSQTGILGQGICYE